MDVKLYSLAVGERFKFPYDDRFTYTVVESNRTSQNVKCKRTGEDRYAYYWSRESMVTHLAPEPSPKSEPKTEFRFSDLEFHYSENDESIRILGYDDRADGETPQIFTIDLPPAKAARLIEELSTRLARML